MKISQEFYIRDTLGESANGMNASHGKHKPGYKNALVMFRLMNLDNILCDDQHY